MIVRSAKEARAAGLDTFKSAKRCSDCRLSSERWAVSKQCTNCFRLDRSKDGRKRMRNAYSDAADMTCREGLIYVPVTSDNGCTWKVIGLWEVREFLK